jgi:hypothetical protein
VSELTLRCDRQVPYPVKEYVRVPVDRPYPVPVEKIVEKFVKVPTPYPVERKVSASSSFPSGPSDDRVSREHLN